MKKKLKAKADLSEFLKQAGRCEGEITFLTGEGDCLNLKSLLSAYVFSAMAGRPDMLACGFVDCAREEDLDLLGPFLEEEQQPEEPAQQSGAKQNKKRR